MTIEFELNIEDWVAFQVFHLENDKATKRRKLISIISVPIVLFLLLLFSDHSDGDGLTTFIIYLVVSIIWVFYITKQFLKPTIKALKRKIETEDSSSILGLKTMKFDKDFISLSTDEIESKMKWSVVKRILENENYYFLYSSAVTAYIIPKQQLNNLKEFEKLLNNKILSRADKKIKSKL